MEFRRTLFRRTLVRFTGVACVWAAVAFLGAVVAVGQTAAALHVTSNFGTAYRAGSEHDLHFLVRLEDPGKLVERGVVFLNVVEIDAAGKHPQAMHKVFEGASGAPNIFQVPFDGDDLRNGLETTVRVRLRPNAPAGDYALVFQVYTGEETDPHRVRFEDRVAIKSFAFSISR